MREFSNHTVLLMSDSTIAVSSKYTQDLSVQIVFFTFSFKWFLCFYFWAVIWAILLTCSLVCMSLRQLAHAHYLKLASSVRTLLKPYGDTLRNTGHLAYVQTRLRTNSPTTCQLAYVDEFTQVMYAFYNFVIILWTMSKILFRLNWLGIGWKNEE